MAYQIAISEPAQRDLKEITRFISKSAPARGTAYAKLLLAETKKLAEFPELGREVPEFEAPGIRELIFRSHRIVYGVDHADCRIDVFRFWHAARGTPRLDDP